MERVVRTAHRAVIRGAGHEPVIRRIARLTSANAVTIFEAERAPSRAIGLPTDLNQDDNGRPLSMLALRLRFDKARKAAGVTFQFRDIRAKTAIDTGKGYSGTRIAK